MIFGAFERLVALRYLRARRQEGFISVIAIFSLLGIALGVATLIIVMAVMNGFRQELMGLILGVNGHFTSTPTPQACTTTSLPFPMNFAGCRGASQLVAAAGSGPGHDFGPGKRPPGALVRGLARGGPRAAGDHRRQSCQAKAAWRLFKARTR